LREFKKQINENKLLNKHQKNGDRFATNLILPTEGEAEPNVAEDGQIPAKEVSRTRIHKI
jgi:hypothetical protein